ncbi:hypothetical protein [Nannocystis punicea]|uniref:Uncharacterized protein n=1 Tax=Nannocystis punicea TaxID=2995304 RepID=A0ABY7H008_9BACT|nr:hypothetical protein [Nannocystis poenicansa]WAS92419.1 hypothetical protein O0S08_40085 [Nannocystis poenicansa]
MSVHVLPPALVPWEPWLALFPAELALSLGPMIQRLAAALGPLAVPAHSGHGEPDGFGGLDRRGHYERLLASEWLLAELAPEEFLRRAAASEHAFLRLERREPALARTSVVLFDSGPTQLGGPRLAQLAALIALARRAQAAHASLAWGVLQAPDVPLHRDVTRETVHALLASRSTSTVTAAHLAAWKTCLGGHDSKDTWIIGGAAVRRHAWAGVATVELRDLVAPGASELAADLRTATGRTADVRLPLPDGPTCVRLIREPFPPERATPRVPAPRRTRRVPVTNLVITNNGERVFAGARGGGVIVYPVPHSPQGGVGKPKLHFPELSRPPVAVGWYNRGSAAVADNTNGAAMLFRKAKRSANSHEDLRYADADAPVVAGDRLDLLRFRRGYAFFRDCVDKLYALGLPESGANAMHRVETETLAVADCPEWLVHVSLHMLDDDCALPWYWSICVDNGPQPSQHVHLGFERPHGAHITRDISGDWQCAISHEPGRWKYYGKKPLELEWRTDDRVIGMLPAYRHADAPDLGPALVTLASDRYFMARQGDNAVLLTRAEEPVVHAVLSTVTGHLAYLTALNTLVVLRPPYDTPLARFVVEDP